MPGLSISPEFPGCGALGPHGTMAGQQAQAQLLQPSQQPCLGEEGAVPATCSRQENTWLPRGWAKTRKSPANPASSRPQAAADSAPQPRRLRAN